MSLKVNQLIGFGVSFKPFSTGLTIAGTGANNADAGDVAWSSPENVTADDGSNASAFLGDPDTSQYLHATNFGFSIPARALIVGIEVRVQRLVAVDSGVTADHTVQLIKGGTRTGDNNADTGTEWPTSATDADYGGASDGWSASLLVSDVNASTFGVAVRNSHTGGISESTLIDAIWINVHYFT